MELAKDAPQWLALVLIALLVLAAVQDCIQLRISNLLTAAILISAIVAAAVVGPTLALWQNLVVFAALLAVGTLLFSAGMFGGGDIKLIAATGMWFNLDASWRMLLMVLLAGGLVTILIVLLRLIGWPQAMRDKVAVLRPKGGIPYGLAIAIGAIGMVLIQRG